MRFTYMKTRKQLQVPRGNRRYYSLSTGTITNREETGDRGKVFEPGSYPT